MKPGIYYNVDSVTYHADPCEAPSLSASIAKILIARSPLHAWGAHPKLGGLKQETTEAMETGNILDTLLAGGESAFACLPYEEFRTKEAKAARDAAKADGKIPMRIGQLDEYTADAANIRARLLAKGFDLATAKLQTCIVWDETATDGSLVRCRGRLDYWWPTLGVVADLKTTPDVSPKCVTRQLLNLGMHIQEAAYTSALGKLMPDMAGRIPFKFLFAEPGGVCATNVVTTRASIKKLGSQAWQTAVDIWAACLKNNEWPDYPPTNVEAPAWMMAEAMLDGEE